MDGVLQGLSESGSAGMVHAEHSIWETATSMGTQTCSVQWAMCAAMNS